MEEHEKHMQPPIDEKKPLAIMLPCSQSEFGDFISGLLGKPQTIGRQFTGVFEVTKEDIENTYHLVNQRVHQQNEATLIQFTVKVVYHDNSSVLLNSFGDFLKYNEVRPIVSVAAHLNWTYLIRFRDKKSPEKQEIELSFSADWNSRYVTSNRDEVFVRFFPR